MTWPDGDVAAGTVPAMRVRGADGPGGKLIVGVAERVRIVIAAAC